MKIPEPRQLDSGTWFIQLRLGGESVSVTANKPSTCKRKAALVKSEYLNGKRSRAYDSELTLGEAIDDYISSRENTLSPSTIRGYKTIRRNRFSEYMDMKITKIANWQRVCDMEARECAPRTLKNAWMLVVSTMNYHGMPAPRISLPQIAPNERPYLTHEQIPLFVEAVKGSPCEIPALLALHSLRRSEIYALTWKNVDLKKDTIFVNGSAVPNAEHQLVYKSTNKNKSSRRYVPIMIPELKAALERAERKGERGVGGNIETARAQVNRVCRKAGLPEVGMHGLRHSFASLAYHLGLSERMTMQLGGWADTKTMHNIYTHLSSVDIAKSQNLMKDFFKNAN